MHDTKADATAALHGLSRMDGTMMDALADFAGVVDQPERAAERDEENERPVRRTRVAPNST